MKIKDVGVFVIAALFRCIAVALLFFGIFSFVATFLALPGDSMGMIGGMLIRIVGLYVGAAIIVWLLSKPLAEIITSGLETKSPANDDDMFRKTMLG